MYRWVAKKFLFAFCFLLHLFLQHFVIKSGHKCDDNFIIIIIFVVYSRLCSSVVVEDLYKLNGYYYRRDLDYFFYIK